VFGIKFRRELPEGFKRAFGTGMLPIIIINLFIGYVGRGFIDNAAHLGGLLSGAALASVVEYRRPGARRGVTVAWRVMQALALGLVLVGFYETARTFNSSQQIARQPALTDSAQLFVIYGAAMEQLQQTTRAVIDNRDLRDVGPVSQRAVQVTAPDGQAADLRNRLLVILANAANGVASASPSPGAGPRRPPPLDPKIDEEFQQWNTDYQAWLKQAVEKYTSVTSK